MAQWYLESIETGFSFPEFATTEYQWKEWVNEYIADSKRILTVRRNTTAFSLLAEWGCNVVTRRNGIDIELAEYDLNLTQSEAYETTETYTPNVVRSFLPSPSHGLDTTNYSAMMELGKQRSSRTSKRQNSGASPGGWRQCDRALGRARSRSRRTALLSIEVVLARSL